MACPSTTELQVEFSADRSVSPHTTPTELCTHKQLALSTLSHASAFRPMKCDAKRRLEGGRHFLKSWSFYREELDRAITTMSFVGARLSKCQLAAFVPNSTSWTTMQWSKLTSNSTSTLILIPWGSVLDYSHKDLSRHSGPSADLRYDSRRRVFRCPHCHSPFTGQSKAQGNGHLYLSLEDRDSERLSQLHLLTRNLS